MKATQWLKHLVTYGSGVFMLNALSFLLLPIYTRQIPPADYGVFDLLNRNRELLSVVLSLGMGMAVLTFYQLEKNNPARQRMVFSTALEGWAALSVILLSIFMLLAGPISWLLFRTPAYAWAVRLMLLTGGAELMFSLGLLYMQARLQSAHYIAMNVGRLVLVLAANGVLVLWLRWGLLGILLSGLLPTAAVAALIVLLVLRQSVSFDWDLWKKMVVFSLPFIPGSVFLFVLNNGDRYFVSIYGGLTVLGWYGLGYKIGRLVELAVATPFRNVWSAVMVDTAHQNEGAQSIARISTYLTLAYVAAGLALSLFGPQVLAIITTRSYAESYQVVPLVTLAYLFWSLTAVADVAFYATRKTRVKPVLLGAAAAVSLLLYALLIPRFGMMGAAWATMVSFFFLAVITWIAAQRYLPVRYEYGRMAQIVAVAVALYMIGRPLAAEGGVSGFLWALLMVALFPAALYFTRFLNERENFRLRRASARALAFAFAKTSSLEES